ncbi:hypothetical protein BDA99DRAFT_536220 [Phascolomyces articulosus]|uniref:Uncharacterized protein n=1 Tax=Phascolomyces articulosus TaxID=60185 RepID=A0AAD5PF43_9FUNG|nr:hypothetical protein BDA99DRAFT_536220 [Phascolomyces articulosus]
MSLKWLSCVTFSTFYCAILNLSIVPPTKLSSRTKKYSDDLDWVSWTTDIKRVRIQKHMVVTPITTTVGVVAVSVENPLPGSGSNNDSKVKNRGGESFVLYKVQNVIACFHWFLKKIPYDNVSLLLGENIKEIEGKHQFIRTYNDTISLFP